MDSLYKLLASRDGGDYAYANAAVKASFVGRVSTRGTEIWMVPAFPSMQERPTIIRYDW